MLTPYSLCMGQPGSRLSNLVGGRFTLLQVKAGNTRWDEASVSYIAGFWVIISTLSFSGQACLLNGGDPNTGSPVGTQEGSLGSLARAADPSSIWFSGEGGRSHLSQLFPDLPTPSSSPARPVTQLLTVRVFMEASFTPLMGYSDDLWWKDFPVSWPSA